MFWLDEDSVSVGEAFRQASRIAEESSTMDWSALQKVLDWLAWIGGGLALLSILFIAGRIALRNKDNNPSEVSSEMFAVTLGLILISSAAAITKALL